MGKRSPSADGGVESIAESDDGLGCGNDAMMQSPQDKQEMPLKCRQGCVLSGQ